MRSDDDLYTLTRVFDLLRNNDLLEMAIVKNESAISGYTEHNIMIEDRPKIILTWSQKMSKEQWKEYKESLHES